MTDTTAIDGVTTNEASAPPETPETPARPTPSPARRRRRWLAAAVVVFVVGGAAIWYDAAVIRAHPVRYDGGVSGVQGDGVAGHDDPFAMRWYEAPYDSGGVIHVEFNIHNSGSFDARIRSITLPGVATDDSFSPLYRAAPLDTVGNFASSEDMRAFQPFTLHPDEWATIGWTLSMCPEKAVSPGAEVGFDRYEITYSYLGWTRTVDEPLPTPLQITDAGGCTSDGSPGY